MAIEYVNVKCTNCKGTGRVPIGSNSHKWGKCTVCYGTGKKRVELKKHLNNRRSKED